MTDLDLNDWTALASSITEADRVRTDPPPDLWSRIEAAVAIDEPRVADDEPSAVEVADELSPPSLPSVIDLNVERHRRAPRARRRIRRRLAAAAAAIVVAGVLGTSLLSNPGTPSYTATALNTDLAIAYDGTADATASGNELELAFQNPLPTDEPVELWLLKVVEVDGAVEVADMVSLGVIEGDGVFAIPDGIDVREFGVVDLSLEPDDGDPTHSGKSFLRGELIPA